MTPYSLTRSILLARRYQEAATRAVEEILVTGKVSKKQEVVLELRRLELKMSVEDLSMNP